MRKKKPGRKKWWLRPASTHPYAVLKKKAWEAFANWIKKRDNYQCFTCSYVGYKGDWNIQAGHYIAGRHAGVLFSERGVHAQCKNDNYAMYRREIHALYAQKLIERYGPDILRELTEASKRRIRHTREELLQIIQKYGSTNS